MFSTKPTMNGLTMDSSTTPQPTAQRNEFQLTLRSFDSKILFFNGLYKLPIAPAPSLTDLGEGAEDRLRKFKKTILNEIEEVEEILKKMRYAKLKNSIGEESNYSPEDALADIADWLGDIQIYCASEMAKFGLPITEVLRIIMNSNFSKLDSSGNPIYDEHGKVLKGPGYWKPEPFLKDLIIDLIEDHKRQKTVSF